MEDKPSLGTFYKEHKGALFSLFYAFFILK